MANGSSPVVAAIVGLVIGVVVGWLVRTAVPRSGTQVIFVGPSAKQVSVPRAKLSRANKDVVLWLAKDSDQALRIEFEEQPFQNMTRQANGRWLVDCNGRRCYSGEIRPEAVYKKEYKYWQILVDRSGKQDEADGIIIIDR